MLLRYWSWTDGPTGGPAGPAQTGVPYGPLRYRAWTTGPAAPAEAGLPFGPLRYRAWTSGDAIVVPPVEPPILEYGSANGRPVYRITVPDYLRLVRMDDEELLWLLVTSAATDILQ